jgi:S1-C subfamily serine protease
LSDFRSALKNIKRSIVGIGFRNEHGSEIIGTGSIVHPDGWILTNRHVLEPLINPTYQSIHPDAAAFLFMQHTPVPGFKNITGMGATHIIEIALPPDLPEDEKEAKSDEKPKIFGITPDQSFKLDNPDIGVCRIDLRNAPQQVLPLQPIKITDSKKVVEGTVVGVVGFPSGLIIPHKYESRSQIQLTPLVQVGIISGILPFSGIDKPSSFVLDMMINPGSSGSPVFLENGNVVGLVYATRLDYTPLHIFKEGDNESKKKENIGVYIPTGLGLAVPSARFPEEWLSRGSGNNKKKK